MKHLAALAALLIGCGSSEQEGSQPDGGTSGASGAGAASSSGGSSGVSGAGATGGAAGSTGGAAGSTGGAAGSGGALPSGPYRRVFYDGFEGNFSSEWDQDGSRDLCVVASSSLDALHGPKAGGGMLRCNWNGVVAWNDPASYETLRLDGFSHTKEVLFRFWLRADANTDPKDGAKIYRWGTTGSFGGLDFSSGSQTAAFHGTSGQIGTTFWGGGSELANGAWHEVEVYVRYGESDGEARIWEDGKMLWEAVSVDTTQDGGNISPFHLMSNWSSNPGWEHDAQNHVYWDEFEVYADSASGSQAAGSLADGSAHL